MELLQGPQLPQVNYMEKLQEELNSCCLPAIKDMSKVTTDEITRDMYRVLTGNGNMTGGLIVKVATANVNIQLMQQTVGAVIEAQKIHIKHCNKMMDKAEKKNIAEDVKNTILRTTIRVLWENKTFIGGTILAIAVYFNGMVARQAVQEAKDQRSGTEVLVKQLDSKITNIAKVQSVTTTPASRTP